MKRLFSRVARFLPAAFFLFLLARPGTASTSVDLLAFGIAGLDGLGGTKSGANAINERGQVAGWATAEGDGTVRAVLWDQGEARDLGVLPGTDGEPGRYSLAHGINNLGQVVGRAYAASGAEHAFLWSESSGMIDLGTLPGEREGAPADKESVAHGVNDRGQVVGWSGEGVERRAFLWQPGSTGEAGKMRLLRVPDRSFRSVAFAINNEGQIVGEASPFDRRVPLQLQVTPRAETDRTFPVSPLGSSQPAPGAEELAQMYDGEITDSPQGFLWQADWYWSLGTLGGAYSGGLALNDSGWVVGASRPSAAEHTHAFLWTADGGIRDIGTLGGAYSKAFGVNNKGNIVGWSLNAGGEKRAVLWQNGRRSDLNDLIPPADRQVWTLTEARDVSDQGQIVGQGIYRDESGNLKERGFLLTPTATQTRS